MTYILKLLSPERNFEYKPSQIPNSGNGLFALEPFSKGEPLFIAFAPMGDNGKQRNIFENLSQNPEFKGENSKLWEAHYHQLFPNDYLNHNPELKNAASIFAGDFLLKVALRDIVEGEELFSDYTQTINLIESRGWKFMENWLDFPKQA